MRLLFAVCLAALACLPARAADPSPFADDIQRLESKETDFRQKIVSRKNLRDRAEAGTASRNPKIASENRDAARVLSKAIEDTRESLATVRRTLRKLKEFGGLLAELKLKPKALFGVGSATGNAMIVTKDGARKLTPGEAFEGAGLIRTGDDPANIILPNGVRMTLAPRTQFDTQGWTLHGGKIYYETVADHALAELKGRWKDKFQVRTSAVVIAVRGTKFTLGASSDSTTLTLFDGEVEITHITASTGSLPSGEPLAPGAAAETGPGETRLLSVQGGLFIRLEPESRVEAAKSGKPLVFLRKGQAGFAARAPEGDVQVLVPNGKAQAANADWSLKVTPSGAAELMPRSGVIVMTAEDKRVEASALDPWWDTAYRQPDDANE
ncbi:MAG: FecR family protein [Elusimicrobiota bacterium]